MDIQHITAEESTSIQWVKAYFCLSRASHYMANEHAYRDTRTVNTQTCNNIRFLQYCNRHIAKYYVVYFQDSC